MNIVSLDVIIALQVEIPDDKRLMMMLMLMDDSKNTVVPVPYS